MEKIEGNDVNEMRRKLVRYLDKFNHDKKNVVVVGRLIGGEEHSVDFMFEQD